MLTIRWLHLTDLHYGDPHVRPLWSDNIEAALIADLAARASELGGPLDLLLFTGDLVYSGHPDQFRAFEQWLQRLYGHLDRLGLGTPALLAVPGNHDLARPDAPQAQALISGWHDGTLPRRAHPLLTSAFAGYSAWWQPHSVQSLRCQPGLLPGDFSTTLEKDHYKLGLVGLNSAFLHLIGGDLQGQLALGEEQLSAVCGPSVNGWLQEHHLTLLLTHHPPSWLRDRQSYQTELAPPGRFAVHLCGHMHTPESHSESRGEGPLRRLWQGASLFGLDAIDGQTQREHGYALGVLSFEGDKAQLRHLPRRAIRPQDGAFTFVADTSYHLDGNFTLPATLSLSAPPPPGVDRAWQPPGGPYDPAWYVPMGSESEVVDCLRDGTPLLLIGPAHCGKSTFLGHIKATLHQQEFWQGGQTFEVSCSQLDGKDLDTALEHFAQELCRYDDRLEEVLKEAHARPLTKQRQISRFFERGILSQAKGPILLVLDNADSVITRDYAADLVSLLRVWVDRSDRRLRLVLTAATSRFYSPIDRSAAADLFHIIELLDLDESATGVMAHKYLPAVRPPELLALREHAGGHPYFLRFYLYQAARRPSSLLPVLADLALEKQLIRKIDSWLRDIPPAVLAEIARCYGPVRAQASQEVHKWLRHAGLLSDDERRLRSRLYERFFLARRGL